MLPELRELTYKDRLKEMGLPILQDRRERSNNSIQDSKRHLKAGQAGPGDDEGRNQTDERTLKKDKKESVFKGL